MSDDEVRAAAERLIGEVANHRFVMQHAYDPDMRFVDDIETVVRATLEAGQEVARLKAALGFYAEIRQYNGVAGDPSGALPPIVTGDRGARARAALSTPGGPESSESEPRPILELLGALPNLTGDLTAVEYVRQVRDGAPETEPESSEEITCLDAERVGTYLEDVAHRYVKRADQGLTPRDDDQFRRFAQDIEAVRRFVSQMIHKH